MDFKALGSRLGLTEDDFIELVGVLVSTAEADIKKLKISCENENLVKFAEAAHSLKGATGNLGFMEMADLAQKAEIKARDNDKHELSDLVVLIDKQLEAIRKQLG